MTTYRLTGVVESTADLECPCCRELGERDEDGTPVAEREQQLLAEEDWEGLIALRERLLDRHPGEAHCMLRLAEVHLGAGDAATSLEVAARGYREHPDDLWLEDAVLDALFALGRSEEDFDWPEETPPVLRLGEEALKTVHRFAVRNLEERDEPTDALLAYHMLEDEGYLPFGPEDLVAALEADPRFVVDRDPSSSWFVWIRPASPVPFTQPTPAPDEDARRRHQ